MTLTDIEQIYGIAGINGDGKVAVIGAGNIAQKHLEVLRDMSEAEVTTLVDTHAQPLRSVTVEAHEDVQRVRQWTGIPVCVGFGQTKTLAKMEVIGSNPISPTNIIAGLTVIYG